MLVVKYMLVLLVLLLMHSTVVYQKFQFTISPDLDSFTTFTRLVRVQLAPYGAVCTLSLLRAVGAECMLRSLFAVGAAR